MTQQRPVPYGDVKRIAAAMERNRRTIYNWLKGKTKPSKSEREYLERWFPDVKLPD